MPQPSEAAHITPEQALANTRALLKAKRRRTQAGPNYPADDPVHHGHGQGHGATPPTGAPPGEQERHFGDANQPAILGHVSSLTRANQSKRDRR